VNDLLATLWWLVMAELGFILGTWVLYLAVMNLAGNRAEMSRPVKLLAYGVILPIGYVCDAVLNLHFCLAVQRLPRDWLLTGTLKRTIATESGWREAFAAWVCLHLLDPFDPKGRHC